MDSLKQEITTERPYIFVGQLGMLEMVAIQLLHSGLKTGRIIKHARKRMSEVGVL